MNKEDFLYRISLSDLENENLLSTFIYPNLNLNYYISDDFSKDFYIKLASCGFISTSILIDEKFYLLPEIQFEYAVLEFKYIHISKKVKKLLNQNSFKFHINKNLNLVLKNIKEFHKDNWLTGKYQELILSLENYKHENIDFELLTFELYDEDILVAGEIGYKIGKTYTSLTGFSSKDKIYNNWGKLQMILTSRYLEENEFSFWNLGHPYMTYKFDLGATLYTRKDFLAKWLVAIN